ncbi:hypothetical protein SCHPADRAFT_77806 [Schizopora paradoxa]|uniref:Uncharacterized protein n=1 Tax=Schizopora paradoxa TaxID=27342 RepID=A0A0H2S4P8_9AGAM|nr:hypothetical protein SCHPADRAFT_77806 [Schizopora paradoxa]
MNSFGYCSAGLCASNTHIHTPLHRRRSLPPTIHTPLTGVPLCNACGLLLQAVKYYLCVSISRTLSFVHSSEYSLVTTAPCVCNVFQSTNERWTKKGILKVISSNAFEDMVDRRSRLRTFTATTLPALGGCY